MKNKNRFTTIPLTLILLLSGILLIGCQQDVGVITNIVKYDVTGHVLNSSNSVGIDDAEILLEGTPIANTDTAGKYILKSIKPGDYLITAQKDGYSDGRYDLTVSSDGVVTKAIMLKELAPAITIGATGGSATATNTTGTTVAELTIPAGELSSDKQISITNLAGNEVPKILEGNDKLLGTTVALNSNDENISFAEGAALTFKLPYRHRPGDSIKVDYFNETTNAWDTYQNAVVNEDGLTADVKIHHFSTYSATVNGNYTEQIDYNLGYQVVGTSDDYQKEFKWDSSLHYPNGASDSIDHEWLYKTVEGQTDLNFSTISYGSTIRSASAVNQTATNISSITPAPTENPEGFRNLPRRQWELVQVCCIVYEWVSVMAWIEQGGYLESSIGNEYNVCAYIWYWRTSSDTPFTISCDINPPITIVIERRHSGGNGD
jgi:hypothetical protein